MWCSKGARHLPALLFIHKILPFQIMCCTHIKTIAVWKKGLLPSPYFPVCYLCTVSAGPRKFPANNSTYRYGGLCKGNRGCLIMKEAVHQCLYVHVGVITNLSTEPTDWKYVKFTWGSTDPGKATQDLTNTATALPISAVFLVCPF